MLWRRLEEAVEVVVGVVWFVSYVGCGFFVYAICLKVGLWVSSVQAGADREQVDVLCIGVNMRGVRKFSLQGFGG